MVRYTDYREPVPTVESHTSLRDGVVLHTIDPREETDIYVDQ